MNPRLSRVVGTYFVSGWMILFAAVSIRPLALRAQSGANTGQIVGQVLDPSGAAVARAEVTVRNQNTNLSRSTIADDEGRYAVSLLPLGPYEVTIRATGFAPATQEALVTLGSTLTADFHLRVGVNREEIEVTADVRTAEPTVAPSRSVLTELQLRHLPSNGGRVQNIIWDVPTGQIEPE